mmetsp:Transcript_33384/g.85611  ORF Transcript_33384/g.85611 Transcript_33384/m.85611 type:complete len:216 (-) Transcript_33384:993-1640(-)
MGVDQPRAAELLVHALDHLEDLLELVVLLLLHLRVLCRLGAHLGQLRAEPRVHLGHLPHALGIPHPLELRLDRVRVLGDVLLLVVELVDKLVELEVLVLRLKERLHQLIDVLEASGLLQLGKGLLEALHVGLGRLVLCRELLQLRLVRELVLAPLGLLGLLLHPSLDLPAPLLLAVHLRVQGAPLGVELLLVLEQLPLVEGHLLRGLLPRLERDV